MPSLFPSPLFGSLATSGVVVLVVEGIIVVVVVVNSVSSPLPIFSISSVDNARP